MRALGSSASATRLLIPHAFPEFPRALAIAGSSIPRKDYALASRMRESNEDPPGRLPFVWVLVIVPVAFVLAAPTQS